MQSVPALANITRLQSPDKVWFLPTAKGYQTERLLAASQYSLNGQRGVLLYGVLVVLGIKLRALNLFRQVPSHRAQRG